MLILWVVELKFCKGSKPSDRTTFTDNVKWQMNGKDTDNNFLALIDR